ncbi:MAG: hypothetical protein HY321_06420 [Armatimonadetes bacterium]|nr:hypothetical protein [Armatimonadota bacterium]
MQPRLVHLSGRPYDMGLQYGKLLRDEVHALAEERLRLSIAHADAAGRRVDRVHCLALAARFLPAHETYAPEVFAEFQGIAEGAGIAPELLLIGNGLTDYRDALAGGPADGGCTAFWARREAAGGRTLCGQSWDMHLTAQPFVLLAHRRPEEGPETLSLTTAGCLSLIGVNADGIAIGNNNLIPTDPRPGVIYLAMIHRALAARTHAEAVRAVTEAPRASGHNYYVADAEGRLCDVETTAARAAVLSPEGPTFVHANHYTDPGLLPLAAPLEPGATSPYREARLRALLAEAPKPLTPESIRLCLADHQDSPRSVCVHGEQPGGSITCAVAVICPETREMWARVGNACRGPLFRYALSELGS